VPWKEDMLEEPMKALVDLNFDSHLAAQVSSERVVLYLLLC